jgi:hypothetical protein
MTVLEQEECIQDNFNKKHKVGCIIFFSFWQMNSAAEWTTIKSNKRCNCQHQHITRAPLLNGSALPAKGSLINDKSDFCQSFYHIRETMECDQKEECLAETNCSTKVVVGIVSIGNYIAKYTNCKDVLHAEDYLFKDLELIRYLETFKGPATLKLFLTLLPCHFSSNNVKKSCTVSLLKFREQYLQPRGIELEIIGGYPYRVHWEILNEAEVKKYGLRIQNAKKGMQLISKWCRAFKPEDWEFIEKLAGLDAPLHQFESRAKMDQFTDDVIRKYRQ